MPDLSTADISRALRERLKEDGSWRVPSGNAARRSVTDPLPIFHKRVLLGSMLALLLFGGAVTVLLVTASPPTLASQVLEEPTQNRASTTAMPELWLTPGVTSDAVLFVDARPTAAATAVERPPTPTRPPAPVISVPLQSARTPAVGAITTATEHLGNLTVDAQLTRAIAFGVEQRLEISARSDSAPLVGAHVSLRITNSFGSSVQTAPDTDRSGRSSKAWPTYRSVGLNQVRVLISLGDGRELSAQLAFLGASSEG